MCTTRLKPLVNLKLPCENAFEKYLSNLVISFYIDREKKQKEEDHEKDQEQVWLTKALHICYIEITKRNKCVKVNRGL